MELKINVDAKENSTTGGTGKKSGKFLLGQIITIQCSESDTWNILNHESKYEVNANGTDFNKAKMGNQAVNTGTLVGSFDDGKHFFPIGLKKQITVFPPFVPISLDNYNFKEAELTLWCWDTDNYNNSGTINVTINSMLDE